MKPSDPVKSLPIPTGALIFPSASHNFSQTLNALKQSTLRIENRLKSIAYDAHFVSQIADTYGLPLVANERCGTWYITSERKAGSVYFKSTDGHQGQWSFSTRRLNLHLLDVIGKHDGCIIVDSTRRGKSIPDALSKTVPIWCAVLNRLLFEDVPGYHSLHTPAGVVEKSEQAQIEARLDAFLKDARALHLDIFALRQKLKRPLRPTWVTQDSFAQNGPEILTNYYPIICCTASRQVEGTEASEDGYIQGAGDDSEGWAKHLTPAVFWRNKHQLMKSPETDLPDLIAELAVSDCDHSNLESPVLITPTQLVCICRYGRMQELPIEDFDAVVFCTNFPVNEERSETGNKKKPFSIRCGAGKLGSRDLRIQFPKVHSYINSIAKTNYAPKMLFACPTGTDLSVGVALAMLCLFFDHHGAFFVDKDSALIDKLYIRRRLAWITTSKPEANPSRSTLQAVNSFLMQRPD